MSPRSSSSASDDSNVGPDRFFELPREVRQRIYKFLVGNELEFDLKDMDEYPGDKDDREPGAGLLYVNKQMRREFSPLYLADFMAEVKLGGEEDIIKYDSYYTEPEYDYMRLNGITHFSCFTIDYETNCTGEDRDIAGGKITITVKRNDSSQLHIKITGEAYCDDDEAYDEYEWAWFGEFKRYVEGQIRQNEYGLISWELMGDIHQQLQDDVEDLREVSRKPQESSDEEEDAESDIDDEEDAESDADDKDDEDGSEAEETSSITSTGVEEDNEE